MAPSRLTAAAPNVALVVECGGIRRPGGLTTTGRVVG